MKFDLHVHTDASPDSLTTVKSAVAAARKAGLDGIALTNHNKFVTPPQIDGFIIIPGCEYTTDAGHILTYFINSPLDEGLEKNAQGQYHWRDIVERARAQNAIVILAHPYAPEWKCRDDEVYTAVDGLEGYNARIEHSSAKLPNPRAQEKIVELSCAFTAGSDAHFASEIGAAYWEYSQSTGSYEEIYDAIKSGSGRIYGGRAKSIWRPLSSWQMMFSNKSWRRIPNLIARTAKAVLQLVYPKIAPTLIDMKGWEKKNENI